MKKHNALSSPHNAISNIRTLHPKTHNNSLSLGEICDLYVSLLTGRDSTVPPCALFYHHLLCPVVPGKPKTSLQRSYYAAFLHEDFLRRTRASIWSVGPFTLNKSLRPSHKNCVLLTARYYDPQPKTLHPVFFPRSQNRIGN